MTPCDLLSNQVHLIGRQEFREVASDKKAWFDAEDTGRGRIGDRDYATITFKKILIPARSGNVAIEPATVTCSALVGYEKRRNMFQDDFFSDFFNDDFFGRSRRGVYRTVAVPSNPLSLRNVSRVKSAG